MKAIKFNADYELTLFENKESLLINQALEFLAFFIEKRPIYTSKKYSDDYLDYVENIIGHRPVLVNKGEYENWWGPLVDIPKERRLNSKELSASFSKETQIIQKLEELKVSSNTIYLAKSPFGMSGKSFIVFRAGEENLLATLLNKTKKLIIEPLFNREKDFSHYIFPSGEVIAYENIVDKHFQYKGTLFNNLQSPDIEHLSFYKKLEINEWEKFGDELKKVISTYFSLGAYNGFSVDSFTYLENTQIKIRTLSEVNCRKTMGLIAWEIAQRIAGKNSWFLFTLSSFKDCKTFQFLQEKISPIKWNQNTKRGCLLLSPGNSRFEIFCISATSGKEGREILRELKNLLPDGQFPI
jgi:hypothetical protein